MAQATAETSEALIRSRAEFKGWLNEQFFLDAKGREIQNPWHVEEWFYLAEKHDRLLIEAAREHGKTSILAVALPLIEMKLNRNIRILIVSDVFEKSTERARLLREHITTNPRYRSVVPEVRITRKSGDHEFTIERDLILKEPTIRSTYAGGPISGSRWDLIILDDLVNFLLNSATPQKRKKLLRWYADEVLNSVAEGGKVWCIGTRQHHDDLYEHIKRDASFTAVQYPALDEHGDFGYVAKNKNVAEGDDALCLWPAMHDYRSLVAKREANPDSFARQQMLIALPETGLVYRKPLMDAALARGKEVEYDSQAAQFIGLDPGYGKRAAMLCIQERTGDRVEMWREHSFTQMDDDAISAVVTAHCGEYAVEIVYVDAEDPGLRAAIRRDLWSGGVSTKVQGVSFSKYKRDGIKITRWLLQSGRLAWKGETTTVHTPGRVRVEPSIFRDEISSYALQDGEDDMPQKSDDHGPDAWVAYAARWKRQWLKVTEQVDREEAF